MSERQIRDKLARLCAELDRHAAAAGPIAVTGALMLSAGVAMTACGDNVETVGQGGSAASAAYGGSAQTLYGVGGTGGGWGGTSNTVYGVGGQAEGGGGTGGTAGGAGVYGVGGGGQGGAGGQAGAGGA